ncbi:hypothetical protein [Kingella oralis]|uniref:hypothetical protein n=1 Tax=Kingella oralis TaxID=505 RepID=UPI0034E37763
MKTIIEIELLDGGIAVNLESDQPLPKTAKDETNVTQDIAIIALAYIRREMEMVLGKPVKVTVPWEQKHEPLH